MNLFFDTSALVKFFHDENGTQHVTSLITDSQNSIWILEIANLEFRCALYRRFRNNEIGDVELNQAIHYFSEQLESFYLEPMGHGVIDEAGTLLETHGQKFGLRTLDALHPTSTLCSLCFLGCNPLAFAGCLDPAAKLSNAKRS